MKLGPLRNRSFRLLFTGRAISSFGDGLVPVALVFAVLHLTHSPSDLGIVLAAQTVPLVLFVLIGGVWADRLPRQRVMLASDLVRFGAQGGTAALILAGGAEIWQLAALQAVYGIADGFFTPAANGVVPQVVADDELQQANALLGLSENATWILGPAIAGVLVVGVGPGWGIAVDAGTFVLSAAFLAVLPVVRVPATTGKRASSVLADLRGGWQAFRSRSWLLVSVGYFTLIFAFGFSTLSVLGPEVAERSLGGPGAWAAISTATGVGALLGVLLALRWRPTYPLRAGFTIGLFGTPLTLLLLGAKGALWLILVTAVIEGVTTTFFNAIWFTAMQQAVPPGELSRVTSWDAVGSYALKPVGLAVVGPIAVAAGISTTLYGAGTIFLLITVLVILVPSVRTFRGGLSPTHLADEPQIPPVPTV
ncbi:MAG TPA: MFS transporter [Solirubrobacteraceae bacterium]